MKMRGLGETAQHFRDDGKAKAPFPTQEAALDASSDRIEFEAYECSLCHRWHLGHRSGRSRRRKARKARKARTRNRRTE
jgi:hypothetical protein